MPTPPEPPYNATQVAQATSLYNDWENDTLSEEDAEELVNNPEPEAPAQKQKRNKLLLAIAAIAAAIAAAMGG